jgi:hypothetical protein
VNFKSIILALNWQICFDIVRGKNGRPIFINVWRKADDTEDCDWQEMAAYCRVKGGY